MIYNSRWLVLVRDGVRGRPKKDPGAEAEVPHDNIQGTFVQPWHLYKVVALDTMRIAH